MARQNNMGLSLRRALKIYCVVYRVMEPCYRPYGNVDLNLWNIGSTDKRWLERRLTEERASASVEREHSDLEGEEGG